MLIYFHFPSRLYGHYIAIGICNCCVPSLSYVNSVTFMHLAGCVNSVYHVDSFDWYYLQAVCVNSVYHVDSFDWVYLQAVCVNSVYHVQGFPQNKIKTGHFQKQGYQSWLSLFFHLIFPIFLYIFDHLLKDHLSWSIRN